MLFKYVGYGDTPPEETNFMGRVEFTLNGPAVEVTDPAVVKKLKGNMCFVEVSGEAKDEEKDEVRVKRAYKKRKVTA